jgi:tetratricopeptide (TPR) repeat protein
MKKCVSCLAFIAFIISPVIAQINTKPLYHQVTFDVEAGLGYKESLIRELAERFDFYNQQFQFNPARMVVSPLMVRVFGDRGEYNDYVSPKLGRTQAGAVYLHPRRVVARELVINRGSPEERTEMPRQAFFQFICAFIPDPPSWLKEGFAVYYTNLLYNENSLSLNYQENVSWLTTVKNLGLNTPSLEAVLMADSRGMPANFQAMAWALVSFFTNAGTTYADVLAEIIRSLSPTADANANSEIALRIIRQRIGLDVLKRAYDAYFASRKTFNDIIADGQKAYNNKDFVNADLIFLQALEMQPNHYMPYYYLGLSAFESKIYDLADQYFRIALEQGADRAMVLYAMGLNSHAWGRNSDAVKHLEEAVLLDPARYRARSQELLIRLKR